MRPTSRLGDVQVGTWIRVRGRLALVCRQATDKRGALWTWIRWGGAGSGSELQPAPWGPDTECRIIQKGGSNDAEG